MIQDPLGEDVALAFMWTTPDQRKAVALDWETPQGQHSTCTEYAKLLHLNPDGLLIASLLEVQHPSICQPNGKPRARQYGVLLKLAISHIPVDK